MEFFNDSERAGAIVNYVFKKSKRKLKLTLMISERWHFYDESIIWIRFFFISFFFHTFLHHGFYYDHEIPGHLKLAIERYDNLCLARVSLTYLSMFYRSIVHENMPSKFTILK